MALSEMHVGGSLPHEILGEVLGEDQADIETQFYPEYADGSKVVWFVVHLYRTAHHANIYRNECVCVCVCVFQIFIELNLIVTMSVKCHITP